MGRVVCLIMRLLRRKLWLVLILVSFLRLRDMVRLVLVVIVWAILLRVPMLRRESVLSARAMIRIVPRMLWCLRLRVVVCLMLRVRRVMSVRVRWRWLVVSTFSILRLRVTVRSVRVVMSVVSLLRLLMRLRLVILLLRILR